VQRGWKSYDTSIAEGKRIQYNFVKPHIALKGKTPSDAAGLKISEGQNRWLDLLESSIQEKGNIK
jgi:hypothetical protein